MPIQNLKQFNLVTKHEVYFLWHTTKGQFNSWITNCYHYIRRGTGSERRISLLRLAIIVSLRRNDTMLHTSILIMCLTGRVTLRNDKRVSLSFAGFLVIFWQLISNSIWNTIWTENYNNVLNNKYNMLTNFFYYM